MNSTSVSDRKDEGVKPSTGWRDGAAGTPKPTVSHQVETPLKGEMKGWVVRFAKGVYLTEKGHMGPLFRARIYDNHVHALHAAHGAQSVYSYALACGETGRNGCR